jgi:hypothetical protein
MHFVHISVNIITKSLILKSHLYIGFTMEPMINYEANLQENYYTAGMINYRSSTVAGKHSYSSETGQNHKI